jgi:hypothetical protein
MSKPTREQFDAVADAYEAYVTGLRRFVDAMAAVGVRVKNVEPFANFAEVLVAREFGGSIQPPANRGFDVLTDGGTRIQVKSLRVSSDQPGVNGIHWYTCTRVGSKADGALIDADRVSVVVYLDFRPFALLDFPVELRDDYPVLRCSGLYIHQVEQFVDGRLPVEGSSVRVIDLRGKKPSHLPAIPPATPAIGD